MPAPLVTVTSTVPTVDAGALAISLVGELNANTALSAPKRTSVVPVKPLPVIFTSVPPPAGPLLGPTFATAGTLSARRCLQTLRFHMLARARISWRRRT